MELSAWKKTPLFEVNLERKNQCESFCFARIGLVSLHGDWKTQFFLLISLCYLAKIFFWSRWIKIKLPFEEVPQLVVDAIQKRNPNPGHLSPNMAGNSNSLFALILTKAPNFVKVLARFATLEIILMLLLLRFNTILLLVVMPMVVITHLSIQRNDTGAKSGC